MWQTSQHPQERYVPFDVERVRGIVWAFDEACKMCGEQPPADGTRDLLAKAITELAKRGESDVIKLRDGGLARLRVEENAKRAASITDKTPLSDRYRAIAADQRKRAQEARSDEQQAVHLRMAADFDLMADEAGQSERKRG